MQKEVYKKTERALSLIAKGERSGVELLYECMGGIMMFIAQSVVKDKFAAEDVVQESFLKVVRNIEKYRRGTNGYAWVCRIVHNTALNALKAEKPSEDLADYQFVPCGEDSEERTAARLTVQSLLNSLPPAVRDMVYMKYYIDMTVREIAANLGVSKSYVSKEIVKAEQIMREMLNK